MSGIYGEKPENGAVSGANDMENPFPINPLAASWQETICEPRPTGQPAEQAGASARRRRREPAPGRPWRQAPAGAGSARHELSVELVDYACRRGFGSDDSCLLVCR